MDCSWGFGNSGCRGGFSWKALVWARNHGVASSHSYGRYLAQVIMNGVNFITVLADVYKHALTVVSCLKCVYQAMDAPPRRKIAKHKGSINVAHEDISMPKAAV